MSYSNVIEPMLLQNLIAAIGVQLAAALLGHSRHQNPQRPRLTRGRRACRRAGGNQSKQLDEFLPAKSFKPQAIPMFTGIDHVWKHLWLSAAPELVQEYIFRQNYSLVIDQDMSPRNGGHNAEKYTEAATSPDGTARGFEAGRRREIGQFTYQAETSWK
ncbi:hypothetical protein E2P81_ATG05641 [Venturia nashicola]|uniref:Uncharacterized protein n=1 Tax=Venturia nashicola TaxID=86259 RepID=A0A4Z1PH99_9PEZI|nr:hypothetical protein E6O75_ATG05779 [Venturia nashicola]TLD32665.1 hypothetical protein E2P81_ATG05641 [Venturia nashicola]